MLNKKSQKESSVFFSNFDYDGGIDELTRTMQTPGPVRDMKIMFEEKQGKMEPKGYGFVTYNDPDTAMCALRKLNGLAMGSRSIKVGFASDKESGTNLKDDEVKYRDNT